MTYIEDAATERENLREPAGGGDARATRRRSGSTSRAGSWRSTRRTASACSPRTCDPSATATSSGPSTGSRPRTGRSSGSGRRPCRSATTPARSAIGRASASTSPSEKEAELQLRAAEERYRLVVEELPAIAYVDERRDVGDQRTWPCIYVSPQVETILGFTPEEWVSGPETWDDMIHPDDLERATEADARHYELGEPVDVEIRVKSRDGSYRWIRRPGRHRPRRHGRAAVEQRDLAGHHRAQGRRDRAARGGGAVPRHRRARARRDLPRPRGRSDGDRVREPADRGAHRVHAAGMDRAAGPVGRR